MKKLQLLTTAAGLWLMSQGMALAAGGGTGLPWDQPSIAIQQGLMGAPAHAISVVAIALAGFAWMRTNHSIGSNALIAAGLGIGCTLGALDILNAFGFAGAVF